MGCWPKTCSMNLILYKTPGMQLHLLCIGLYMLTGSLRALRERHRDYNEWLGTGYLRRNLGLFEGRFQAIQLAAELYFQARENVLLYCLVDRAVCCNLLYCSELDAPCFWCTDYDSNLTIRSLSTKDALSRFQELFAKLPTTRATLSHLVSREAQHTEEELLGEDKRAIRVLQSSCLQELWRWAARLHRRWSPSPLSSDSLRIAAFKRGQQACSYAAGPKLRKWYGEGERRPQDGGEPEQEEPESEGSGDAILVTDADSRMGELIILQLILAR